MVLIVSLVASAYMAGVIWLVQLVHYPLMSHVPPEDFKAFHKRHSTLTSWVVAPAMFIELGTALYLFAFPPAALAGLVNSVQLGLAIAVWVSTFAVQVPLHGRLSSGWDPAAHSRLVRSNWARTFLWTTRAALLAWVACG